MAEFQQVCRVGEVPEGEGKTVTVGGKLIAVFRTGGEYHAIDDMCPHMGASLSGGYVENGIVTCPWHAWRFRLERRRLGGQSAHQDRLLPGARPGRRGANPGGRIAGQQEYESWIVNRGS